MTNSLGEQPSAVQTKTYGRFLKIWVSINGGEEVTFELVVIDDTTPENEALAEKAAREIAKGRIDAYQKYVVERREFLANSPHKVTYYIRDIKFRIELMHGEAWVLDRIRYFETLRKAQTGN
jgi:hypothetical protein